MRDWPQKLTPRFRRAVFLDRDGTINKDTNYPHKPEELELIPNAADGLAIISALPLHLIVVSNQSGIALGRFTTEQMSSFNERLRTEIQFSGARIDAFYYCPYLDAENLPPNKSLNECVKPNPGMLREAADDYGIDLAKSFLIGDKTSDIAAGESVGCVTILVKTGKAGKEKGALPIRAKYIVEDLYEAALIVQSILSK